MFNIPDFTLLVRCLCINKDVKLLLNKSYIISTNKTSIYYYFIYYFTIIYYFIPEVLDSLNNLGLSTPQEPMYLKMYALFKCFWLKTGTFSFTGLEK